MHWVDAITVIALVSESRVAISNFFIHFIAFFVEIISKLPSETLQNPLCLLKYRYN